MSSRRIVYPDSRISKPLPGINITSAPPNTVCMIGILTGLLASDDGVKTGHYTDTYTNYITVTNDGTLTTETVSETRSISATGEYDDKHRKIEISGETVTVTDLVSDHRIVTDNSEANVGEYYLDDHTELSVITEGGAPTLVMELKEEKKQVQA